MNRIKQFFAPPVFEGDEEKTHNASLLNTIIWFLVIVRIFLILRDIPQGWVTALTGLGNIQTLVGLVICMVLLRWKQIRWSAFLALAILILNASTSFITVGGLNSPFLLGSLVFVLAVAALLLGEWGAILFTGLINLVFIAMAIADTRGLITNTSEATPINGLLVGYVIVSFVIGFVLWLTTRTLGQSLRRARENEQAALQSNRELDAVRRNLEVRVAERTRDLTLSAEIGRFVAQEHNLNFLLPNAVERIREAFALYYAQIYLTDATERVLILRAGSGAVGQELLRRGHRLPLAVGSINGSAAFTQKAVIVEDTAKSTTFLPNPLLPKTRSEMAIPLLSGERVLGVLNMQSEYSETFTQETLTAYGILAGQLAAAIENAHQFTEIERARTQIEMQSRLLTREGWDTYLDAVRQPEYIGVAYQNGEVENLSVLIPQTETQVAIPISVAGAEIGSIQLDTEGRPLSTNDQELVARLVALAGQHIENLRLLAETERFRREAEGAVRRLAREGWETYEELASEKTFGYIYTQNRVKPLKSEETDGLEGVHTHALTLHGEPIGKLALALPDDVERLDDQSADLVSGIAEALTAHIENLRLSQATEAALAQTENLYNITTQLTKAQTLEEILKAVASLRKDTQGIFFTLETNVQGLPEWVTVSSSWPPGQSPIPLGTRFPIAIFAIAEQWINNPESAILSGNIETDSRIDAQTRTNSLALGIKASAYLPLKAGASWVGLITLSWGMPQTFTTADEQLFDAVTAQAAVVANNRLLFEQTTKRAERETLINTINQRIQGTTSVDSALQTTAREIGHLLRAHRAVVEIRTAPPNGQ